MKYNGTPEELNFIRHAIINTNGNGAYISCQYETVYCYLTVYGDFKRGEDLVEAEAYHENEIVAQAALEKWVKSKEIFKETKVAQEPVRKRMSKTEFRSALSNF